MSDQEVRDLWDALEKLRSQVATQNVILAELKTLLTERHSAMQNTIACIESERRCEVHAEKIKTITGEVADIKKGVIAVAVSVIVLAVRVAWEFFTK